MTTWMRRLVRRLRALRHGESLDRDVRDEMRLHVDLEANDLMRSRGLEAVEARRQALVAFGGIDRYHEAHRDARGIRWLEELGLDVRYAARSLSHTPSFTIAAIAILALGIGATTAVFSGVNAVLVAHLPYPHDEQLVRIYQQNSPTHRWTLSLVDLLALQSEGHTFSAVGAVRRRNAPVTATGEPQNRLIASVTAGFFQAFGVRAARGRLMDSTDNRVGAPPVVVVSHAFATEQYGSDAGAVGRGVLIDGSPYIVIGVLPPDDDRLGSVQADVWPAASLATPARRGPFGLYVVGRLADGVTPTTARRNLVALSEQIFPIWKGGFQDSSAKLTPVSLRESVLGNAGTTLGILAAAVGLILLIAIANVASLMLVRATGRQRELSLRATLGATRTRLVRLLVTESALLSMTGAAAGLVVGALGLRLLVAIGPHVPRLTEARLDLRAVAFATGVAILAGVMVGAYPVLSLFGSDGTGTAGGGDRTVGPGLRMHRVRGAFVIAEFALALPLLAGAGLLMTSLLRLERVTPGFDPARVALVAVSLPSTAYSTKQSIESYWNRASAALHSIPGVTEAGLGSALPPDDQGNNMNNFDLVDHPVPAGAAQPESPWPVVTNSFFAAMGIKLFDGRLFEPTDTGTAPVIVVSHSWATHYFPGEDAVGRQVIAGGCVTCPRTTIVGVVSDLKLDGLREPSDDVYSPATEGWSPSPTLYAFVRTSTTSDAQLRAIRENLHAVDRGVSLSDATPMTKYVYDSVAQPRNLMTFLGGFAVAALALAAVGIFGMLSYLVTARRREIGMRMALGARAGTVVSMMVRRGMEHAAIGAVIGLLATAAGARVLTGELFDVGAADPATLAEVTVLLLAVALMACWLPARRAAAIDPARAIRDSD